MSKQRKGAAIAFAVGIIFVALEIGFSVATGIAGVFVVGMAAGLLIGDQMARASATPA